MLQELNANAWATWKESSRFQAAAGFSLNAQIETSANDNRKNAIQYILLHELGHVLSVRGSMHPPWDQQVQSVPVGTYPFVRMERPWHIAIQRDGNVVKTFEACWEVARCALKRAILERQLK